MIHNEEKYQNILEQIHELNRQNFLNDNEKLEELLKKISDLEKNISKNQCNDSKKKFLILIGFFLINLIISFYIISNISNLEENKIKRINEKRIENLNENNLIKQNNINTKISIDDKYQEISPIIRKGTLYFCNNESETNKIPYTVEIKGKLYENKFVFLIKENTTTKECFIKKENM